MEKRILCPERLRKLPNQWSWVDQRLVRLDSIPRCDARAWAMYLFLITVGDKNGLSYYADSSISEWLGLNEEEIKISRRILINANLIVYQNSLYQVLSLPEPVKMEYQGVSQTTRPKEDITFIRDILQKMGGVR